MKKTHRIMHKLHGYIRPYQFSSLGRISPHIYPNIAHTNEFRKTINGQIYNLDSVYKTKSEAQKSAEIVRKAGFSARIFEINYPPVQDQNGQWYSYKYGVYAGSVR